MAHISGSLILVLDDEDDPTVLDDETFENLTADVRALCQRYGITGVDGVIVEGD